MRGAIVARLLLTHVASHIGALQLITHRQQYTASTINILLPLNVINTFLSRIPLVLILTQFPKLTLCLVLIIELAMIMRRHLGRLNSSIRREFVGIGGKIGLLVANVMVHEIEK